MKRSIATGLLCVLLAACTGGGPRKSAILGDGDAVRVTRSVDSPFAVIDVDTDIAHRATRWLEKASFTNFISNQPAQPVVIGVGDTLDIAIVSTSESGFIDLTNSTLSPVSTTPLPQQVVASDGRVTVPPLGRVRASGQTIQQFENLLRRRLGEVLVEPSAIVNIVDRSSTRVSVLGQVANPGIFPVNFNNEHLVEMIAEAGGPLARAETLEVSLSRGNSTGVANLQQIYETPSLNVHLRNGDVISVESPANNFTVLGAGGVNTTIDFDEPDVTLADALGQAGGLLNQRADREGVFLYRTVSKAAAIDMGANTDSFGDNVPTIFRIDMSEPQSIFTAQNFAIADGDVLYIADNINEEINAITNAFEFLLPEPAAFVSEAAFGTPR